MTMTPTCGEHPEAVVADVQSWYRADMRSGRLLPTLLMFLSLGASPCTTWAQSAEELSGARAAASEGLKAFRTGRYEEAIDYFSRAESLVHAPPHWLYLARSHAALGHLVQAREIYIKLRTEEIQPGKPKPFFEAKAAGTQELALLEPRIPYVKVLVEGITPATADLTVDMDGTRVPAPLVGISRPVDPGKHEFVAMARGFVASSQTIDLVEGARETVMLRLVPATAEAHDVSVGGRAQAVPPIPDRSTATASSPRSAWPPREAARRDFGVWPWVSLGVGAVGLGVGVAFLAVNASKRSQADELCPNALCPASRRGEIESLDADANGAAIASTLGMVTAALGIGGGAALLYMRQTEKASTSHARSVKIDPWIGVAAIGVRGTFQ